VQAPKRRESPPSRRPWLWALGGAAVVIAISTTIGVAVTRSDGGAQPPTSKEPAELPSGLPEAPDYHSLSVNPSNANRLLLGTHHGLYSSTDGGKTWQSEGLDGQDAMNLARAGGRTLWTAGHNVFVKSTDGGKTWVNVSPSGLPSLDLHGFAVDPRNPNRLYAAVAGQGLFRSDDGGRRFAPVSAEVGGAVMALAVMPSGAILAGDMQQGLLLSRNGGVTWRRVLRAQLMGLAVNPRDPDRVLAAGKSILLSTNGGRTWQQRLGLAEGAGPVAWSRSNPRIAYVVSFDRTLYRSIDGGKTWSAVA
jgi:photosystem II stability/assembly factor-like uncharacterized protein